MKSPYPWFGGKMQIASLIWERLGDPPNYIEPFFGGGAVTLLRPSYPFDGKFIRTETINDINAWVSNFWRSLKLAPETVAEYASDPISEIDLHARGDALFHKGVRLDDGYKMMPDEFVEKLRSDPEWCDPKIAGWWVWGQSAWIGSGWDRSASGQVKRQRPHLRGGTGINRKLDRSGDRSDTRTSRPDEIREYLIALRDRMSRVRVCCGDWSRVVSPTLLIGTTGVFLDPPYAVDNRYNCYGEHDSKTLSKRVEEWCIQNGDKPNLRIALCGYTDEHAMPDTWSCMPWKAMGGYSRIQGDDGNENCSRERIWFSPHCLLPS